MRHVAASGRPSDQPRDGGASSDLQMRGTAGHRRDGCLNHASPAGDALEHAILLAGRAPERLGGIEDGVEANGPRCDQCLLHFGQFRVEEAAIAGQEEVRKPELVDPLTLPGTPDLLSPGRRRPGVSFQDHHLVAIPAKQKPSTEANDPSTDNHDLGHGDLPLPDATVTFPESTQLKGASGGDEMEVAWRRQRRVAASGGAGHVQRFGRNRGRAWPGGRRYRE